MLTPEQLQILRCPIDPTRTTPLVLEDQVRVMCSQCHVQFKTREGIVNMIVAEAILPEGCSRVGLLPCVAKK